MSQPQKLDRFDALVPREPFVNPWQPDGTYVPDFKLLGLLLGEAIGTEQSSGIVAGATDVWAAEELRRAGFGADDVWPRRESPRVLPRDVREFVERGLTRRLRAEIEGRYNMPGARRALPAEARVMGSAYLKQGDVVIASWATGVEVLISTKTMLSSYAKNLRNRFEEGYGDAKNLRGRHPLSALGFLFVVGADITNDELGFAVDMLRKLRSEPDVYDCSCLLILDEEQTADAKDRDPSSATFAQDGTLRRPGTVVKLDLDRAPEDLSAGVFFRRLVEKALSHMPVDVYEQVRQRQADARS